ncbi:MAG: hypothetical protein OEZ36_00945 [Spirochaetota bacterium]|nr:hypothetical protein [Spirochaetota bacterium]
MGLRKKAQYLSLGLRDKADYLIKKDKAKYGQKLYSSLIERLTLTFPLSISALADSLINICLEELLLLEMTIIIRNEGDNSFSHFAYKGYDNFDGNDFQLAGDNPVIACLLDKVGEPVDLSEVLDLEDDDPDSKFMRHYHLNYGIAMGYRDKVHGFIFLGRREYDEPYEEREEDFLRFLSSYSAMLVSLVRESSARI